MRARLLRAGVALALFLAAVLWWKHSHTGKNDHDATADSAPEMFGSTAPPMDRSALGDPDGTAAGIAGHIRDTAGNAIEGAIVCARPQGCPRNQLCSEEHCAPTSRDGAYHIARVGRGGIEVSASARGYAPEAYPELIFLAAAETRRDVDLQLGPAEVGITGTVLDATGGVVAGATVEQSYQLGGQVPSKSTSDDDGRFSISTRRGLAVLLAHADGYAAARFQVAAPASDVVLSLEPESRLSGTVYEKESDRRVPYAVVQAVGISRGVQGEQARAQSGKNGVFSIAGLRPGRYRLSAHTDRRRSVAPVEVNLGLSDSRSDLVLEVEPSTTLRGKLLIADGDEHCPVWGRVSLVPEGSSRSRAEPFESQHRVPPGEDVLLEGVRPGRYKTYVFCEGFPLVEGPETLTVADVPMEDIVWRFGPAATLSVQVRDRKGNPLAGVTVDAALANGVPTPHVARTEADGTCELVGLPAGTYTVSAHMTAESPSAEVEIAEGQREARLELTTESSASLVVVVTTPDGEPFSHATVITERQRDTGKWVMDQHAKPLGDGRYAFHPIAAGSYAVKVFDETNPPVQASAGEPGDLVVVRPDESLEIAITYGGFEGELSGKVVDERGAPVANAWIDATAVELKSVGLPPLQKARVYSDRDGEFTVGRLRKDAAYDLEVRGPSGSMSRVANITPGKRVAVVLKEASELGGTVVDGQGSDLDEFTIRVTSLDSGDVRQQAFRGTRGRWAVRGLTPGQVKLEWGMKRRRAEQLLQLEPAESRLDLALVLP